MPYQIAPRYADPSAALLRLAHVKGSLARLACLGATLVPLVAAIEAAARELHGAAAGPPPLCPDVPEETPTHTWLLQSALVLQQSAPQPAAAHTVAASGTASCRCACPALNTQPALLEASERDAGGGTTSATPGVAALPRLTAVLAYAALLLYVGAGIFLLDRAHRRFCGLKAAVGPEFAWDFWAYLHYSFARWFSNRSADAILLAALALLLLFSGAALCRLFSPQHFDEAIFRVYTMIVDPAVATTQPSAAGKVIGLLLTVGFLVVLGLGLAMIQAGFARVMHSLVADYRPVVEAGHILLIGHNGDTPQVIEELCRGYEPAGGATIVLLAEEPRSEVEESLKRVNSGNSTVVVRSGVLDSRQDLGLVSADSAKMVVLMPHEQAREAQDSLTASVLITLGGCGWPVRGRILAVCALAQNRPLFQRLGGPTCDTVSIEDYLGKLVVQCSHQPGIGVLVHSLFSFKGSELYIAPAPGQLLGQTFGQARFHYPSSILVGVASGAGCRLCPSTEYVLTPGDELVLVAEDSTDIAPTREPIAPPVPPAPSGPKVPHGSPSIVPAGKEKILVLGWNDHVGGVILLELDRTTHAGSTVVILSPQPTEEREECLAMLQRRTGRFAKIRVQQVAGKLGSRQELDSLPVKAHEASRIFILSEHAESTRDADRCTIMTLLQVREIIASSKEPRAVPIVPEIRDHHTKQISHELRITDFVESAGIAAQALAAITYTPKLAPVFTNLVSESGTGTLHLRSLKEYLPAGSAPPANICFWEVMHYVAARGDVVIGWSFSSESAAESERPFDKRMAPLFANSIPVHWEMNPQNKAEVRTWNMQSDRLAVFAQ